MQSTPGETAILQATTGGVARVFGSYWTLRNLVLDNAGQPGAVVTVTPGADHFTLLDAEVRNGTYYGVDVWGPDARVQSSRLHNFRPDEFDTSDSGERHCLATHSGAWNLVVDGNLIYDCWGDGVQMYEPDTYKDPAQYAHHVVIANNTFRRGSALAYASNAIDIKGVVDGLICHNDLSGYTLPQVPIQHLDQSTIVLHHGVQDLRIEANRIHDGYQGLLANSTVGGQLAGVIIRNNDLRNLAGFGLSLEGLYDGSAVQNNTLTDIAGGAIQIGGQGLQDSQLDHNLIIASGPSKLFPDAEVAGTTFGPNAWYAASRGGALANDDDVPGEGDPGPAEGFGVFSGPHSGAAAPCS
jgi:hypothetical protein